MIILISGIIILCLGLFLCYKGGKAKAKILNDTDTEILECRDKLYKLQNQQYEKTGKITELEKRIDTLQSRIIYLQDKEQSTQEVLKETIENKESYIQQQEQQFKNNSQRALAEYENEIEQAYLTKEIELKGKIDIIHRQRDQIEQKLNQLKQSVQAATAARLIEQEENNKWIFYSINLTNEQLNDILELQRFKNRLNDPSLVGKIIWSAFVLKATNDLCNRVLGTTKKCGIYKITNRENKEIYIGQSLSVADRWKSHIKCGLGIDAPATNKLYNKMQEYGVWMFTFELLEECSKEKLNEREKFWINFYQSDKWGMNLTKGNK